MKAAIQTAVLLLAASGASTLGGEPPPGVEKPFPTPTPAPSPVTAPPVAREPGRLIVELRDAETRKPAAARVRVSSGDRELLPQGAVRAGGGFFLAEGSTRLEVPAGSWRLQVDGGPMRLPYDHLVGVAPGGTEERTIFLVRPRQYAFERAGWVPADPLYSAGTVPPAQALIAARSRGFAALGLDDAGLAAAAAAGKPPRWVRGEPVMSWRLSADPAFGTRCSLRAPGPAGAGAAFEFYADCSRPRRVNPWRTLVPWRPELREFYDPLAEATVGLAPRMYYELLSGGDAGGFELDGSAAAERLWFALLSEGWRLPAVAGSRGALSSGECPEPRMLLRSESGKADPAALVAAARAGRSVLSFGPYCFMAVDGRGPGEELPLRAGERRVLVRALATTERRAEISRIELWRNGRTISSWQAAPGQTVAEVEMVAPLDEPGWMLAKCYQRVRSGDDLASGASPAPETVACTNPIWIVPESYRISLSPVVTRLSLQIVDEATGKGLAGSVVVVPRAETIAVGSPAKSDAGAKLPVIECPADGFVTEVSPGSRLVVGAPGHESRTLDLFDELGLPVFAKRLAAMPPEKAVEELSSSKTLDRLRRSMARLELVVKLRRSVVAPAPAYP